MVSIFDTIYNLEYSDPLAGDIFMKRTNFPYNTLKDAFGKLFSDLQVNYKHCLLTVNANTVAIFQGSDEVFKIFDSHLRDLHDIPHPFGKCVLVSIEGINNLIMYFQNTVSQTNINELL